MPPSSPASATNWFGSISRRAPCQRSLPALTSPAERAERAECAPARHGRNLNGSDSPWTSSLERKLKSVGLPGTSPASRARMGMWRSDGPAFAAALNVTANTAKPTVRRSANANANTVRAVLWKRPSAKGRDALSRTSFSRGPVPGLLFEAISVRASKRPYCHIIHSKGRATAAGRLPIESQYRYL